MPHLVNRTRHLIKALLAYVKINYLRAFEYRADFFMAFAATSFHTVGYVAFLWAILGQVPTVSGWNFDRMLTLFAANQVMIYLSWAFFRFSLVNFTNDVRDGNFDIALKMPISARFTVSFKQHNTDLPLPLATAVCILIYSLRNAAVTFPGLVLFMALFILGFIILYNMLFLFTSLSFWVIEGQDLTALFEETFSYSRYPMAIFPTAVNVIFLAIVPILLMIYVPVTALFNVLDFKLAVWSLIMVFVTWFVSEKVWHAGLRHYSSASS